MKNLLLAATLCALLAPATLALSVDDVIMLHQAGVSAETIQTQIDVTGVTFHLKATDIARLAKAKIPPALIQHMIKTAAKNKPVVTPPNPVQPQPRQPAHFGYYSQPYIPSYSYYGLASPSFYDTTVLSSNSLFLHQAATSLGLSTLTTTFGSDNTYSGTFSGTLPTSSGFTFTSGSSFTFTPDTGTSTTSSTTTTTLSLGLQRGGTLTPFKMLGSK